MPPRFHIPALDAASPQLTLAADESRHLARVLRLRAGDLVDLFDGVGLMVRARVVAPDPAATVVAVEGAIHAPQPEAPHRLVVCAALLKGDAMDVVVRDATVLGATAIVPMLTRRTAVPSKRVATHAAVGRWQRVAIAAAKQCGRAVLPRLDAPRPWAAVSADPAWAGWQRRLLVEPAASRAATAAPPLAPRDLVLAIGPEGGWAPEEVGEASEAGWTPWSLGPFTVRAEHVALAALAVVRYAWEAGAATRDDA